MSSTEKFDGRVLRAVKSVRGGFQERFVWAFPPFIPLYVTWMFPGAQVVDEFEVRSASKLGPVPIFFRPLPEAGELASMNIRPIRKLEHVEVDVSDAQVMPDADFWGLMSVLGGDSTARSVRSLSRALRERGDDAVAAFEKALHLKLRQLDHPDNAVRTRGIVSDDASIDFRLGIIAEGEESFRALVADPGSRKPFPGAEPLLFAASRAHSMHTGLRRGILRTGIRYQTGENEDLWPPRPPVGETSPFKSHREMWEWDLRNFASAFGGNSAADPWYQVDHQKNWYAVYSLTSTTESLTLQTLPKATMVPTRETIQTELDQIRREAEGVDGVLRVHVSDVSQPMSAASAGSFERLTKMPIESYLKLLAFSQER